ncbi:hypothetical protein BDZ89DRAFT_1131665 [Hymenopellis radicata]|nr:hypothetical protein BDZ89DRAFT_1131665 [Hymenopellis radicata]
MFGSGVQSSWANNNNNQQQPSGSVFGQPSAFGQSAFSGGGAFGQNTQQQQQPAVNPMFGGATTGGTSGFGAFSTPNNNASTSAFGSAVKPATGFGAFSGGNSAFGGGGGAFGQTNNNPTSAFGNTNTGTSAFGSSTNTGVFGQPKPATSAFGAPTDAVVAPVTTGSANPAYAAFSDKETGGTTSHYQSITAMPIYRGTSFEELRSQDYSQGRKTASTGGGAFGQAAFGGTSAFGQPAQTSAFGAPTNTGGAFGAFAQPQQTSAFGGASAFGQNTQQQQQQQQTSAFGNSAFGTTANKPATGFGAFSGGGGGGTTGAFGSTGNTGGSLFGQTNTQQQQQPTSVFGQTNTANNTGLNAFANNANKPSVFGQPAQTTNPTGAFGSGTSIFGNTNQSQPQQNQPAAGTGLFGSFGQTNNNQQQQQPAPSLFGGNTNTTNTTNTQGTGGGLFGGGGGLFGNNNAQQQTSTNPLFGNKQPSQQPSLFGSTFQQQQQPSTGTQTGGIFGSSLNQNNNANNQSTGFGGGSLFGNKSTLGTSTQSQGSTLFGNSTFNTSTSNAGAQGTLTASISQPIATNNVPIFSLLSSAPQAPDVDTKKLNFFVDVPTRINPNRSTAMNSSSSLSGSKLRGFGPSPSLSDSTMKFSFTKGTPHGLSVTKPPDMKPVDSLLGRSGSPALGSGNKKSVKKLVFDKKVEATELFVKSGTPSPLRGKVVFTPALSIAQREKEAEERSKASQHLPPTTPTPAPRQNSTPNRFTAEDDPRSLHEGDYWVKPEMAVLRGCGYDQISSFKDLVVGRVGYGEIHFLEPVDLTGLPKLGSLLGEMIRFDDKECSVYPDSDDVDKPPAGSGLNVRARIILKRCWAVDKANREPIRDEKHPLAVKHLKRLKGMKDTHFEGFDIKEGTWTFTVDHF